MNKFQPDIIRMHAHVRIYVRCCCPAATSEKTYTYNMSSYFHALYRFLLLCRLLYLEIGHAKSKIEALRMLETTVYEAPSSHLITIWAKILKHACTLPKTALRMWTPNRTCLQLKKGNKAEQHSSINTWPLHPNLYIQCWISHSTGTRNFFLSYSVIRRFSHPLHLLTIG
jgi:hypothetical protein